MQTYMKYVCVYSLYTLLCDETCEELSVCFKVEVVDPMTPD